MYVGGGDMVDAPETGQDVMIQPIYELNLLGGRRPYLQGRLGQAGGVRRGGGGRRRRPGDLPHAVVALARRQGSAFCRTANVLVVVLQTAVISFLGAGLSIWCV